MSRTFDCSLSVRVWHGLLIDLRDDHVMQAALWSALANWNKLRWIDVYTFERVQIGLFDGLYTATFQFPQSKWGWDFELIPFVYDVSILRNGNPFRFRHAVFDDKFRESLQHAFSYTSAKNTNKWWPQERVYAEQHLQKLVQTGQLSRY